MIHYALRCGSEHAFDGWFRDSAAYEAQAAAGLISCPTCGERQVARALMAPAVRTKNKPAVPTKAVAVAPETPHGTSPGMPDAMRALLQRVRAEVEANCDYVGDAFAAEVRAMHDGEQDARPIYGEATDAQAEALADDGIEVGRIPWLPRSDA